MKRLTIRTIKRGKSEVPSIATSEHVPLLVWAVASRVVAVRGAADSEVLGAGAVTEDIDCHGRLTLLGNRDLEPITTDWSDLERNVSLTFVVVCNCHGTHGESSVLSAIDILSSFWNSSGKAESWKSKSGSDDL